EAWAKTAALPNVQVAGKTGTAETDADAIPHAWFTACAPAENPGIAVAVVQEHAGGGSTRAGPVVRRMLEVGLQVVPPCRVDTTCGRLPASLLVRKAEETGRRLGPALFGPGPGG